MMPKNIFLFSMSVSLKFRVTTKMTSYLSKVRQRVTTPPYGFAITSGDARLRLKSKNVEVSRRQSAGDLHFELDKVAEFKNLVEQMEKCMKKTCSCGLSAPQVGVNQRVIMFYANLELNEERLMEKTSKTRIRTFINPSITNTSNGFRNSFESCASVPAVVGDVHRHKVNQCNFSSDLHRLKLIPILRKIFCKVLECDCLALLEYYRCRVRIFQGG